MMDGPLLEGGGGYLSTFRQGRTKPEVEGGGILERGANNVRKSKGAKGARKVLGCYSRKFAGFSTE